MSRLQKRPCNKDDTNRNQPEPLPGETDASSTSGERFHSVLHYGLNWCCLSQRYPYIPILQVDCLSVFFVPLTSWPRSTDSRERNRNLAPQSPATTMKYFLTRKQASCCAVQSEVHQVWQANLQTAMPPYGGRSMRFQGMHINTYEHAAIAKLRSAARAKLCSIEKKFEN